MYENLTLGFVKIIQTPCLSRDSLLRNVHYMDLYVLIISFQISAGSIKPPTTTLIYLAMEDVFRRGFRELFVPHQDHALRLIGGLFVVVVTN